MLSEFENKPTNGNYLLIKTLGDIKNPILQNYKPNWTAKDVTNIQCVVYNIKTDRLSTKSAYLHPDTKRLYLKSKDGRLYLDEFKQGEFDEEYHNKI